MSSIIKSAEAFNPADSIAYADNLIVSKSILKKSSGNITFFAFDKGEGLSEHSSPHDAVVQILDGRAEVRINDQSHHVKTGECIILPASIPHALSAPERFKNNADYD